MILIGILTYIAVVLLSILASSSLSVFLNVPSPILVIDGIISIIIVTKSFSDIIYSLKNVINEKLPIKYILQKKQLDYRNEQQIDN